jgi:hypothetical protein
VKQSRKAIRLWLPVFALAVVTLWLGCEQKGDMNPAATSRQVLTFLDTVYVNPSVVAPGESASLSAHVLNENNGAAAGEHVRFSLDRGSFAGVQADTTVLCDQTGWARATFTAPADSGDILIRTELLSMAEVRTTTVHVSAIPAGEGLLSLRVDADTLFADNGVSTTHIYAHLRNEAHNPLPGELIYFSTSIGSVTSPATTDSISGTAVATLVSTTEIGTAVITATHGSTRDSVHVTFLQPAAASSIVVSTIKPTLIAGSDSTSVTAYVRDANNLPIADNTVVLFSTSLGTLSNLTAHTVNGAATTTLHASLVTGSGTITASTGGNITGTADFRVVAGPASSVLVTASSDTLYADNSSQCTITAWIRDALGNGLPEGLMVTFTAQGGTVTPVATTGPDGHANATFRAGLSAGTATIIAQQANAQGSAAVYLNSTHAASLQLSVNPVQFAADGVTEATVRATVLDAQGAPVSDGTSVTFRSHHGLLGSSAGTLSLKGDDPSPAPFAISSWSRTLTRRNTPAAPRALDNVTPTRKHEARTNSLFTTTTVGGYAVASLTSPTAAGPDTISAVVQALSDSQSVYYTAGTPALVEVIPDAAQLPADGVSSTAVNCRVKDAFGNPVGGGVAVAVSVSLGQASPTEGFTGANGTFVTYLTTSRQTGRCAIVATATGASGYGEVQFITPNVAGVVVSSNVPNLLADGVSSVTITARALDASSHPIQGASVLWDGGTGIGHLTVNSAITDTGGYATATFYSGASNVDAMQNVRATIGTQFGERPLQMLGVSLDVTSTEATILANGTSTTNIRVHLQRMTDLVAISGATLGFGTSLGSIPASSTTDSSGNATVLLTSSVTPGVATVVARFGNLLTDTAHVTYYASAPSAIALSASPTVLVANNASTSTISASVTDQDGGPVPNGTQIHFSIQPQNGTLGSLQSTQSGVATNVLTAGSEPGTVQIIAWAEADPTVRDTTTVVYTLGPPAVVILSAQHDTLAANGFAVDSITAHVTDAIGHALTNVDVHFSTTIGNITPSRVTDSNGNSRVAFTSSQTGAAQITATAGGASDNHTVYLVPGNPNSISLTYDPGSVGVQGSGRNETLLISATVRDVNNNPVIDGTPVSFNIASSPGGGDFLSSTGPISTINGQATVSYSSGTRSGSVRIRALCNTISAVSTEVLIYAGPPYMEDVANACVTSHMSLAAGPCNMFGMDIVGDSVVLTALVGDRYNNPVTAGTAVYFTTSGGVITTGTGYTDSLGFARVTLYSGHPLPDVNRWLNTLTDPNVGGPILCSATPTMPGMAKVMASSAGVDASGDSIMVWAATDVVFNYSQPILQLRSTTVNGDPNERTLYIGENALITVAAYDPNYWPLVSGSTLTFSANHGAIYPEAITVGCPGDTSYTISFFNNLNITDDDAASPVLVNVDTRQGDAYVFTQTFTLRAAFRP